MGGAVPNCHGCRSWVDDIYWNHFQFLHFAQFLRSGYDQSLALPKTFSDNLKRKLPENVTLKGPGGVVWNIGLTTRDDTLYFTNGWQEFVKDHTLKENDFLIFKYNGESLFEVLIFDGVSLCENAASYFVRKCGKCGHSEHGGGCLSKMRDTDNSLEEGNTNTPSNADVECASPEKSTHVNNIQVPFAAPSETPSAKNVNAGAESISPEQVIADGVTIAQPAAATLSRPTSNKIRKLVSVVKHVQTKRKGRGRPPKKASVSGERDLEWVTDTESGPASVSKTGASESYMSNRRPVTENEINKALQLAQAVRTDDSLFIVMRPTHVYKRFYLSIPNKWIPANFSQKSQDMILRIGKQEWPVKYSFHNIRQNGGLTGGWKRFAVDNNLEEFDVCVFKPAGQIHSTLIVDVSVFRVVEEIVPLIPVNVPSGKRGRKSSIRPINVE